MSHTPEASPGRKVFAAVTTSMDGFTAAPGGDVSFLVDYAISEDSASNFAGIWSGASTAVMGRTNYEGFFGYWPPVARDPNRSPRDRDLATWLDDVDKVVVSRTLESADWKNSRIARDPEAAIKELKSEPGRDIIVLNSASIIQALLRADLVDELRFNVIPRVLGSGLRLYDNISPSEWSLVGATAFSTTGTLALQYRRA